jgi:hypothetical protein
LASLTSIRHFYYIYNTRDFIFKYFLKEILLKGI